MLANKFEFHFVLSEFGCEELMQGMVGGGGGSFIYTVYFHSYQHD